MHAENAIPEENGNSCREQRVLTEVTGCDPTEWLVWARSGYWPPR